ncbi:GNAT family N-acetyltransferase [Arthrobacter cupressi]
MTVLETARLRLRPMTDDDLEQMSALLGDSEVMRYYPAPKTRVEAQRWIDWNKRNYAEHGFGLWIMEDHHGNFIGDCGLTIQNVDGTAEVEVGYHVVTAHQGKGYATEAAQECLRFAAVSGIERVIAIIDPANAPSQRVAEKAGLHLEKKATRNGREQLIFAITL